MSATTADYQNHFHPREYLRQYYSAAALTDDEAAIFRFLNEKLAGNSFATSLEFGCGPTVHHAFGLLPSMGELHLAEYLEGNRNEVFRWITADEKLRKQDEVRIHGLGAGFARLGEVGIDGAQRRVQLGQCDDKSVGHEGVLAERGQPFNCRTLTEAA